MKNSESGTRRPGNMGGVSGNYWKGTGFSATRLAFYCSPPQTIPRYIPKNEARQEIALSSGGVEIGPPNMLLGHVVKVLKAHVAKLQENESE